ncbi:transcription initiation factor IIE, beta subunit [Hypoxylon crocopeplum]|nr:transcription initiation factor IIE, beta subunit [Hypoxylon crocopeplum]
MSPTKPATGVKRAAPSSSAASPSFASKTDGTSLKRQKRDRLTAGRDHASTPTPAAAAAMNQAQDSGSHIMTQITFATDFLKTKGTSKTLQDILNHLTLQHAPEDYQRTFSIHLQHNSHVQFTPAPKARANSDKQLPPWRTGTYAFKAKLPGVVSKVKLLEYLQHKKDASSTSIRDIKDGWPDCDAAIDELEEEHKILAVRTKKDNHVRYVWLDYPELHHEVDPEFQAMWFQEKLPSAEDMPKMLKALGQKATSDGSTNKGNQGHKMPPKRKKASRVQKKFENEHMRNIFEQHKRRDA